MGGTEHSARALAAISILHTVATKLMSVFPAMGKLVQEALNLLGAPFEPLE